MIRLRDVISPDHSPVPLSRGIIVGITERGNKLVWSIEHLDEQATGYRR